MSVGDPAERPWSPTDLRTSLSAGMVAVVLVLWAWRSASGSAEIDKQVDELALSVVGAIAAVVSASLWVVGGRHAVSARRRAILERLELVVSAAVPVVPDDDGTAELVVVPGTHRYHRQGCLLVQGKRSERLGPAVPSALELRPCEMCRS